MQTRTPGFGILGYKCSLTFTRLKSSICLLKLCRLWIVECTVHWLKFVKWLNCIIWYNIQGMRIKSRSAIVSSIVCQISIEFPIRSVNVIPVLCHAYAILSYTLHLWCPLRSGIALLVTWKWHAYAILSYISRYTTRRRRRRMTPSAPQVRRGRRWGGDPPIQSFFIIHITLLHFL